MVERAVERRIVTVLFADLVGFTSLSEGLDAEDVASVQDAYFAAVRETVDRHGGQLEKFIGDAAMAVFGVPRVRDDDAERAARAGLALTAAIERLSAQLGLAHELAVRVGLNTGEVLYGEAGPERGVVTGDVVNTAARLQSAARTQGVLVGEATALALESAFELEPAGALELKGKAEPVRAWHVVAARPAVSRDHAMGRLRAPLVGRQDELQLLRDALSRGAGRRVVVAPPGVGKSRLVDELARGADAIVLRARLAPDVLAPFNGVAQLLLSAIGSGRESDELVRELEERLVAAGATTARAGVAARATAGVVHPELAEAEADRDALFAAWLETLDACLAGRAALWVVDDVHWAGGDLLAFLALAGSSPSKGGRFVVATARTAILETAPSWCPDELVLHLPPLPTPAAEQLIEALVGDALPPELVQRIAERSDGNPLFIEELLRTWVSVGVLAVEQDGTWQLTRDAGDVPLPPTVQAVYAAQLDDLPDGARMVARRASVAGRRFAVAALAALEARDESGVEILARRAFVTGPYADRLGDVYAYRHALLRDAGYASLARKERARLHAALARWLEPVASDLPEQIASHYAAALEHAPALEEDVAPGLSREAARDLAASWFERAAEAALELSAHDAARNLFSRSLELTAPTALVDRARRLRRLGEATAFTADMDEGAALLDEALEVARIEPGAEGRREHTAAAAARAKIAYQQLRFVEAAELADAALTVARRDDSAGIARLLLLRAAGVHGETNRADDELWRDVERAVELARMSGDPAVELQAAELRVGLRMEGGVAEAHEWETVERLAREIGAWQLVTGALRNHAAMVTDDTPSEALPLLEAAAEIDDARALTESSAWTGYALAELCFQTGDWDAAVEQGRRAIAIGRANAYHRVVVRTWAILVPIASVRGDETTLLEAGGWHDEHRDGLPSSPYGQMLRGSVDLGLVQAGRLEPFVPDPAPRLEALALESGGGTWYAAVDRTLDAWLRASRLDVVEEAVRRAEQWNNTTAASALGRGTSGFWRARLLAAAGDASGVAAAARVALAELRACEARWWIARTLRLLESVGSATDAEIAEAAAIERELAGCAA